MYLSIYLLPDLLVALFNLPIHNFKKKDDTKKKPFNGNHLGQPHHSPLAAPLKYLKKSRGHHAEPPMSHVRKTATMKA